MVRPALSFGFGQVVRALREEAGYSQEGFAYAVRVHRTYMGTLERGQGNPTLEKIEAIARTLGVNVGDLLRAAETGKAADMAPLQRTLKRAPASTRSRFSGRFSSPTLRRVAEPPDTQSR
jgi:transcriptional regulator with XRE-family HTH domain